MEGLRDRALLYFALASGGRRRSEVAVLGDDDVGLFVALSGFTKDADLEARQSHRRITLLDTTKLVELWTSHYGKLGDSARRRLPLKPVWFLAGED